MNRRLQLAGLLLLTAAAGFASDQSKKESQTANKVVAPAGGGVPKPPPIPKGAARILNPDEIVTRLFRMTSAEREVYIVKMKPAKQVKARNLLEWYDLLPKEQQEMQIRRIDRFEKLTPEKKMEVRQAVDDLQTLPGPRRRAVGAELFRLQHMTDQQRELTLRRPMFIARFSPEELKLINSLADAWMGPLER